MELYEVKNGLERARLLLNELFVSIDIEGLKREIEGLTVQTLDEHFWNNQEQAKKIYNQLNEMKKTTDTYDDLVSSLNDLDETYDYVKETEDTDFKEALDQDYELFEKHLNDFEKTLDDVGLKMKVETKEYKDFSNATKRQVVVSAVPIINNSEVTEYSNDYGYNLVAKDIKNGFNHCVCLGQGEMTERTVIHLFRLQNGLITQDEDLAIKDGITGINRRTMIYDYSSVESVEELIQGGIDQLNENSDTKSMEISNVDAVDIGDIVGARDRVTKIYMQKKIVSKIVSGYIDKIKIEYKVGD